MIVYTVRVRTRPKPKRTTQRRRLAGKARQAAKACKKYIDMALAFDARLVANNEATDVNRLVFRADAEMMTAAATVSEFLTDQLASVLKIVR